MLGICHSITCTNFAEESSDFCADCHSERNWTPPLIDPLDHIEEVPAPSNEQSSMAQKYPKYYKPVGNLTEVDVYAVHKLFDVKDPSGAIHHASKKLLLSGVRTGGKSPYKDIQEARDTLTRWLQLNDDTQ